jgi:DNA-binding GntR family transcriptional regulator
VLQDLRDLLELQGLMEQMAHKVLLEILGLLDLQVLREHLQAYLTYYPV